MLERKMYNKLLEWKNKSNKMSLIIKGARQVGKTIIFLDEIQNRPNARMNCTQIFIYG